MCRAPAGGRERVQARSGSTCPSSTGASSGGSASTRTRLTRELELFRALRYAYVAVAFMALTLTLVYNSIFLLPAVLALAARQLGGSDQRLPTSPSRTVGVLRREVAP